jgi:hypothetical protein
VTKFDCMPSDHGKASSTENANMYSFHTPLLRPMTHSQNLLRSAPPIWQSQAKQESQVQRGTWHLCWIAVGSHNGPMCNAICAGRTQRSEGQNYIKNLGYRTNGKLGVIGIAYKMMGSSHGHAFWYLVWFCPNNICHHACPRKAVNSSVPPVPLILEVQLGTNLTVKEIAFLTHKGLDFVGRPHIAGLSPQGAAPLIDVNIYPESINIADLTTCLRSRNTKAIGQKNVIIVNHCKRIKRAEQEELRIISDETVTKENAFGKRFCVCTHKNSNKIQTKEYWV